MTETGADRTTEAVDAAAIGAVDGAPDAVTTLAVDDRPRATDEAATDETATHTPALPGACPTELTRELSDEENRAWVAFLRSHARVTRQLEADLLASSHLPLAEYDVLTQLAAAEGGRLRMHELADRVLLSRAGLTRLIDRLVDDGLVERAKCGGDGRGAYAVLTANGRAHFQAAAPEHMESVKRHFLGAYSLDELERLAALLERVSDR